MIQSPGRKEEVIIPYAPVIQGLVFRRFRGDVDFPIMADVMQRSRDADLLDIVETAEDIKTEFKNLVNCDPHKDILIVEVHGQPVGLCRVEWRTRAKGIRTYDHNAHLVPEWRGKGIRHAMVTFNENRLREIAKGHPSNCRRFFHVLSSDFPNHWKSLVEDLGYVSERHIILMTRPIQSDIPELQLPEGLEVRTVMPEDLTTIWKAAAEAFRDEPNFTEEFWTDEGLRQIRQWRAFKPELWQIAWDGKQVAGGIVNFVDEEENKKYDRSWGYTGGIFVRRPWRNRGLASALIARSFRLCKEKGFKETALSVDTENPSGALRLYEKMGFQVFRHYTHFWKPFE